MRACGIPAEYVFASFILFWILISYLIALVSGWRKLAEYYKRPEGMLLTGAKGMLTSLYLNKSSYSKSVFIRVDDIGMHLSVIILFRFGHPPLFIPWSDIKIEEKPAFFSGKLYYIFTAKAPSISISLNKSAIEKLGFLGKYKFPQK